MRRAGLIWQRAHLATLNKVLFDSTMLDHQPKGIEEKIEVHKGDFTEVRLATGAQEVEIEVEY